MTYAEITTELIRKRINILLQVKALLNKTLVGAEKVH